VINPDKNNPFHRDPASYTIFSSITSKRYQTKIKQLANELHSYAEEHQVRRQSCHAAVFHWRTTMTRLRVADTVAAAADVSRVARGNDVSRSGLLHCAEDYQLRVGLLCCVIKPLIRGATVMLLSGEDLIPVQPLLIKELLEEEVSGEVITKR
jgi:hypothetical protein